jgi:hypothetical protein
MKKSLLYLILISAFYGESALAQRHDTVSTKKWFKHDVVGAAQIQLTYRKNDIRQLNQVLSNNGLAAINANELWINASMSHTCHNWITEDGIGFTPIATSTNSGLDAKYNQYQAYVRLGYNISQNNQIKLFPFVGANFSAAVLNIEDKNQEQSTANFSSELLNRTASKTFYQPNFGIEVGAGFDYLIKLKPKNMGCFSVNRNIPIGVRAGYYFNTYAGNWEIKNYSLQNGPNQKQSNVFISFNIGLGYQIKK